MAGETLGLLQAQGLHCDPASEEWPLMLKAMLEAHLNALNAIAARLDGKVTATPAAPPFIRCEGDLGDLDQALLHWKAKVSLTRTLHLEQDIADYIQGHTPKRASQGYGEFPAKTLLSPAPCSSSKAAGMNFDSCMLETT